MSGDRLLLDTHALIWWLTNDSRLTRAAHERIIVSDEVFVSAASLWEIATKHRSGRLARADRFVADAVAILARENFSSLAISHRHALLAGGLETPHRDPFDRMLIAQAMLEELTLVSNEKLFDAVVHDGLSASRLWA